MPEHARVDAPSPLTVFAFENHDVRVTDRNGDPWFVAKDVAEILGYKRPADAIKAHCKGVGELPTPSSGGSQLTKIIPERDVYRLIMRSKLPAAERFEEWVVGEVLPTIRKTGGYQAAPVTLDPRIDYMMRIVGQFAGNQRFVTEDRFNELVAVVNKMADAIVKLSDEREPEPEVIEQPKRTAKTPQDHWERFVLEWADARVEPFRLIDMFGDLAHEHQESEDMTRRKREIRIARILRAHGYDKRSMKPKGRMCTFYWQRGQA